MMEAYWRLALAAHHREDLALILINRHNPEMTALAASGQLHQVAAIPEPGDVPYYFVVER
jgi:hypothetical protein